MRELVLKVKQFNWGLMGPGDWNNTEWRIYNDLSVEIDVSYNLSDNKNTKSSCKIEQNDYNKLIENVNLTKINDMRVDACDGEAWEIIQYNNEQEIWKRKANYIYDITPLENIATILKSMNAGEK